MWIPQLHPLETVLRATVVFVGVQVMLRVMGRRELSRTSLWDLAALFLVGTALRMTLVADDPSLTTGILALSTLLGWDRLMASVAFRSRRLARIIQGPVVELIRDGQLVEGSLRRTLISEDHIASRLRQKGEDDLSKVRQAFMEPDGTITFLMKTR